MPTDSLQECMGYKWRTKTRNAKRYYFMDIISENKTKDFMESYTQLL